MDIYVNGNKPYSSIYYPDKTLFYYILSEYVPFSFARCFAIDHDVHSVQLRLQELMHILLKHVHFSSLFISDSSIYCYLYTATFVFAKISCFNCSSTMASSLYVRMYLALNLILITSMQMSL